MVWSKNDHFSFFLFLGNISHEILFYDILERKNAFQRYKKKELQRVEKLIFFLKGLTYGFGPKKANFPTFFFSQYRPGKCFFTIS